MDYIRYSKVDQKLSWKEIERNFATRFPSLDRAEQGIQGVYYRQNKMLPRVDLESNRLVYLPNGHIEPIDVKCRAQEHKQTYGLINLFTEDCLNYRWMRKEHRRRAIELGMSPPLLIYPFIVDYVANDTL
jgi:hypothetical protein